MPTVRLPLVGSFTQRGIDGSAALTLNEDQRFLNCTFNVVQDPAGGKTTVYAEKRPGWGVDSLVSTGLACTGIIKPQGMTSPISAFGETNSAVYLGTVNIGNITGRALHFTETLISAVTHVALKSSDGTGWYYAAGAKDVTSHTVHTSSGNFLVSTISNIAGFYTGQLISGGQIGAGARISSITTATSTLGVTIANTATSTGAIITKEPIAKMVNANFLATGTYRSAFAPMDGYLFYATDDGYVNNSNLNSVSVYTAVDRLAVQQSPDPTIAVAIQKNVVVAFGLNSAEKLQNAGFTPGSPLQASPSNVDHVGTLDQRSVTTIEDDIYYVSSPSEGDVGVYRMRGLQSTRISTPAIDRILGSVSKSGTIYAQSFRLGGYPYAAFIISTATDGAASKMLQESGDSVLKEDDGDDILTEDNPAQTASFGRFLVFNAGLSIWSEWDCVLATFIDSIGSGSNNQLLAGSRFDTSGKIYKIDPIADGMLFRDGTSTYAMQIRTARIDHGTGKRKVIPEIRLVCDKQSSGNVTLECSDDDFGTWTTLGTFDLSQMNPKVTRCGSYRGGRAYRLTHSSNAMFRGEAIEIDYKVAHS